MKRGKPMRRVSRKREAVNRAWAALSADHLRLDPTCA